MTMVLDHGYIKLIENWGSDERIIEAARMTTQKGFQGWGPLPCKYCGSAQEDPMGCPSHVREAGDEKLLRYLWKHKHTTPFEMAGATIEVQAPIFVFREWHRHRTQSYSEMSARYGPIPDYHYVPTVERCMIQETANKQAGSLAGTVLTEAAAEEWLVELEEAYRHTERVYQRGLEIGMPKELARLPMTVGRYSRMRASANLLNWLRFLTLRCNKAAQCEIRLYADNLALMLSNIYSRTMKLWGEDLIK